MSTTYKQDDRVQITIPEGNNDTYGGRYFVTGEGKVLNVDVDGGRTLLQVKADTTHPERDSHNNWWVDKKFVTPLVEEPAVKIGDTIISKRVWGDFVAVGTRCIVVTLNGGGALTARVEGSTDTFAWYFGSESDYELVPAAPTKKAIPATETKPQIGDTIVAFWEAGGVETRKKGVIASFDYDGTAVTADGEYITHDPDGGEAAEDSVFIVERASSPMPVKENPNQKWIDAPVGSIAILPIHGFQWLKTAWNEWTFFSTKNGNKFIDRTDATINSTNGTQLVTF